MLNKVKNRKQQGFTIIEVMIVLAIAGLIMLIVFLAVPALQRSSRNTTIKNDASALAASFSEYASNNDGNAPAAITQTGAKVTIGTAAAGTTTGEAKVSANTTVTTTKGKPTTYAPGVLYWNTGANCSGTSGARGVVVYYYPETAGTKNDTPTCVDAS